MLTVLILVVLAAGALTLILLAVVVIAIRQEPVRQTRGGEKPLQAYTVEQVAKMLHIGRDKVYYLLRTGQLRSLKIGKLRRITEQQLAEFIASLDKAV
jgi:excisionase family DNA binding protein